VTSNWVQGRVNDPPFTDQPTSAIFIGANNDDIVVQKNKVTLTTGNGVDITDTNGQGDPGTPPRNVIVRKNKVRNAELSGIEVSATGERQYQVLHNRTLHNTVYGVHFALDTTGGTVTGNTALDNQDTDCKDQSTGLLNAWTDNVGRTFDPDSICSAPTTLDYDPGHAGKTHDKKNFKKHKKHHKKGKKHKKHHRPDPCACTLPWRF
jgi:hypothetical protein